MKRIAACLLWFALGVTAGRAELLYENEPVVAPAGQDAVGGSVTKAADGTVWLSWIESSAGGTRALQLARFEPTTKKWSAPQTVYRGREIIGTSEEFSAVAIGPGGHFTAVWPTGRGRALFSQSHDQGKTWTSPAPLTQESDEVENFSVVALADGRVLAAWLDGRALKTGGKNTQLYTRFLGEAGPDHQVDADVCDCCATSLTGFPDGSALLAYRGHTKDEIRDILVASYLDGKWDPRIANTHEQWKIAGCPVNGPRIASDGPRVSKAWFTAANDEPRVLVATSPDAGGIYTRPIRADLGRPLGRVDTLLLRDGTQLVTWIENTTDKEGHPSSALYLRRYGPAGNTHFPVQLATLPDTRSAGVPRMALVKDFDTTPAQLVVTFNRPGGASNLATLLVTLPDEISLAEADRDCDCGHRPEELRGSSLRGQILSTSTDQRAAHVRHSAIPGVLRSGEHEFKIAPELVASLKTPAEFIGRVEQRDGTWWLFEVRLLGQPLR